MMKIVCFIFIALCGTCICKPAVIPKSEDRHTMHSSTHLIRKRTPADLSMTEAISRERSILFRQLLLSKMLHEIKMGPVKTREKLGTDSNENNSDDNGVENKYGDESYDDGEDTFTVVDMKRDAHGKEIDGDDDYDVSEDEGTQSSMLGNSLPPLLNKSGKAENLKEIFEFLSKNSKTSAPSFSNQRIETIKANNDLMQTRT